MSEVTEVITEVKSKKTRATKPKATEKPETTEKPEVNEKPDAATKKKTVKTKVDKYNGFKVPDKKTPSTRWAWG